MKVVAIIPAAGYGKRMGGLSSKQFIDLLGKPLISWTLSVFEDSEFIDEIVLVVNLNDIEAAKNLNFKKIKNIVAGGEERLDSVYNGLQVAAPDTDVVVIHDGARPLLTKEIIASSLSEVKIHDAVVVGVPVTDTIKTIGEEGMVSNTLDRDIIWAAQTPQVFKYQLIKEAYERAKKLGYKSTDDARLLERLGHQVKMIMGSYENIKITIPQDLIIAEAILGRRMKS